MKRLPLFTCAAKVLPVVSILLYCNGVLADYDIRVAVTDMT